MDHRVTRLLAAVAPSSNTNHSLQPARAEHAVRGRWPVQVAAREDLSRRARRGRRGRREKHSHHGRARLARAAADGSCWALRTDGTSGSRRKRWRSPLPAGASSRRHRQPSRHATRGRGRGATGGQSPRARRPSPPRGAAATPGGTQAAPCTCRSALAPPERGGGGAGPGGLAKSARCGRVRRGVARPARAPLAAL
jgi:hypothetical protein